MTEYTRSPEDIVALFKQRRDETNPMRRQALEVRDVANGDYTSLALPMPELTDGHERMAVANSLLVGLDGSAQRIASTFPEISSRALKHGQEKSELFAATRRRAALGWLEANSVPLRMRRRARFLLAYASSPVIIRPDRVRRIPRWHITDPLSTYPGATVNFDDCEPPDGIVAVKRNLQWLRDNYPEKIAQLRLGKDPNPSDEFDLLEYVDAEQITLIVVGRKPSSDARGGPNRVYSGVGKRVTSWSGDNDGTGLAELVTLEQLPNRAERCTMVAPQRITLDRAAGQYDNMIGKLWWQARLSSLELIAIERGIYPSEWGVFPEGGSGDIITEANGRLGIIGRIEGGEYHVTQVNPGYKTGEAIDRQERAGRIDGKIPPEFNGESGTNIRTDRRGLTVLGNGIDFNHAENQAVFERSLEAELERAVAVDIAYFDERKSFFIDWRGAQGPVEYTPSTHFEPGSTLKARYSAVGVDADTLAQVNMQKIGAGMMSTETAMGMDPTIPDVPAEMELVDVDQLRLALREGLKARAASGELPETDVARTIELRKTGMTLEAAVAQAHIEAQERQAAVVPPDSAAAQAGLANAGAGAEAGGIGIKPADLASLLGSLKVPGRTAAA